jgi:TIR domain
MSGVFIIHSHNDQDRELVRDVVRRLREAGFKTYVDFDHVSYTKSVRSRIRAADAVVILLTPAAREADWPMIELGFAEGLERLIVPVSAGIKPRDVPEPLRGYRVVPFDRVDDAIAMLSEKLTATAKD